MTYLILKALHIISFVAWFAGLFYLPRLFVYHTMADDEISQKRFKVMERRLYYGIMWPGFLLTVFFGICIIILNSSYYLNAIWLHFKLALVFNLIIYHLYCGHLVKVFKNNKNTKPTRFYRIFNEIPTVLLIGIVFIAVLK